MRIHSNIPALNTYNKLAINQSNTGKSLQKLSSGFRINSAADDAAGLMISEKMRAQIRGLDVAGRNANSGMNLVQTAEGTVQELDNMVQRIRELAVQAANDTNVNVDRESLQFEINELVDEVDRVANQSNFNTRNMLNGGFNVSAEYAGDATIGRFAGTGDTAVDGPVNLTIASGSTYPAKKANLQMNIIIADMSSGSLIANGEISINGKSFPYGNGSQYTTAAGLKDAINSAGIGVRASFNTSGRLTLESLEAGSAAAIRTTADVSLVGGNQISTGVFTGSNAEVGTNYAKFSLPLPQLDENGKIAEAVSVSGNGTQLVNIAATSGLTLNQMLSGINVAGGDFKATIEGNKIVISSQVPGTELSLNSGVTATVGGNNVTGMVQGGASRASGTSMLVRTSGVQLLSDSAGFTNYTTDGNKITVNDGKAKGFQFEILSNGSGPLRITVDRDDFTLQVGANKGEEVLFNLGDMRAASIGIDSIKVTTASDAKNSLATLDKALNYVNTERAKVGAIQNRLESTITSLNSYQENLTASESQIRDTDMAKEMMNMTKNNILNQAATAMLAQANQLPQNVLQLLQQ